MSDLGSIYYSIDAKTDALLRQSKAVDKAIADTEKTISSTEKSADDLQKGFDKLADSSKDLAKSSKDAADPLAEIVDTLLAGTESSNQLNSSLTVLARAIQAVIAASALKEIADMVQKYQEMSERVQMATASQEEFVAVQGRLLATANGTYRSLQEAQELYITTADSLRSMGYSTQQALDVTDSMSYAFVKNATSADRAQAAIDALSKSVNTGKVAADQWETISSAIPSVIGDIATASGKTSAEVRALGAAGKLTGSQLTEGLRKSLEANALAAAAMSNNLVDAAVRSKTAMTAFFVEVERQTGTIQALTNGIILAADELLLLSSNSDTVSTAITAASSAAAVLAAVIVGRLAGATAGYVKTQTLLLASTLRQAQAEQAAAASGLVVARANMAAAESALAAARAAEAAAVGFGHHAAAANALAVAEGRAALASQGLTAALSASAGAAGIAGVAMTGLKSVMAFLGGPVGVILIAAAALYYFSKAATDTKTDVDALNASLNTLTFNQLTKAANDVEDDIKKVENSIERLQNRAKQKQVPLLESDEGFKRKMDDNAAALDTEMQKLDKYRKSLAAIATAQAKALDAGNNAGPLNLKEPTLPDDPGAAARIKALQDERDLLQVVGVKRAELKNLQALGEDASPAQIEQVKKLTAEIYALEEAEKAKNEAKKKGLSEVERASKKSAEEEKKGVEENIKTFQQLGIEISNVGKAARDLAQDQAQLSLNKYATPEQVTTVRAMAAALYDLQKVEAAKKTAIAADPRTAAADKYKTDLEQYKLFKENQLITDLEYEELKNAASTTYEAQRLAAQEEMFAAQSRGNAFVMDSINALGAASTQVLSGILSGTMSGQDAMKAFANTIFNQVIGAIVQMGIDQVKSIVMGQAAQAVATGAGVAQAATLATAYAPAAAAASVASFGGAAVAGLSAMAAAVPAMMGLIGGRKAGGPVNGAGMYRVNEGGAPEIFTGNNGSQYLLPNKNGDVTSNKDATGGGALPPIVNIHNYGSQPATVESRFSKADDRYIIDVIAGDMMGGGKTGKATNSITGTARAGT